MLGVDKDEHRAGVSGQGLGGWCERTGSKTSSDVRRIQ